LRKRWKEVGLGLLTMLAAVLAVVGCQAVCHKYLPPNMGQLALAATFLVVYLAGARWIERRSVRELAARRALPEIATGLALGFVLFSAVIAILWAMGVYHPTGLGTVALINGLAMAIASGILEELLFRGILFRLSSRIVGTWGALLFTSALFGLAHFGNPGATLASSLAIMLEAGVLLGAAYAVTGRLWLPIGMHMGWNFTEGSIFGMSVSGLTASSGWVRGSLSGSRLLTGGPFGPEASVVAVLLCLSLAVYLLCRTVKLGRIEPPAWSRTPQHTVMAVGSG
jgi:CAAX protease family protein